MQRYDIINWLIEKYGYQSYLEIGVADGECFKDVNCLHKYGIDPHSQLSSLRNEGTMLYENTSDEFFGKFTSKEWLHDYYDIIFIDGDHHAEQVERDINNSLEHLYAGGTIVIHDCNPPTEAHAAEAPQVKSRSGDHYLWNGTVWKAFVDMRLFRGDLCCRCVDADWGCGIIQRGDCVPFDGPTHSKDAMLEHLTYSLFAKRREEYLNLITTAEFKEIYDGG